MITIMICLIELNNLIMIFTQEQFEKILDGDRGVYMDDENFKQKFDEICKDLDIKF